MYIITDNENLQSCYKSNDIPKISPKMLVMMHLSAALEIAKGNPSDLNIQLYYSTKEYADREMNLKIKGVQDENKNKQ